MSTSHPEPSGSEPVRPGDQPLPWKATDESRGHWGPQGEAARAGSSSRSLAGSGSRALVGTIEEPTSGPGVLGVGVPIVSGGLAALTSLVLGLGNVFAGPIDTAVVAVAVGSAMASGTALVMRALRPKRSALVASAESITEQTRAALEQVLQNVTDARERVRTLRGASPDPVAAPVLQDADALLVRIAALVNTEGIQQREPFDGDVIILGEMSERWIPDLLDSASDNLRFLASFAGTARSEAIANLETVRRELRSLSEGLEAIERDIVKSGTRELEVHSEFLRRRLATEGPDPIFDA
ncbi:hypothetical protein Bequi_02845 [Brachybacterium sp. JHP9]|uniref:5-bromo-4-chloroindolyl phosphate hydrolase n=1 Tax=Brachybacterium equifaecis TaxID=2910770 RepID=A0ABT0QXL9_9MICO|nr:hypothetical protein [Brachybacterium equifaecis]MCL6422330.1 hypothetical protein [Brachybacterium equifaecis]